MGKLVSAKVRDDYLELVKAFPLRSIRDERQHGEAVRVLARLDGRVGRLSVGEREYADALATLIREYENRAWTRGLPEVTGLALVEHLMAEHGMTQKALGKLIGVSESAANMILAGKRELTKGHIVRLAERFRVTPAAFFD